MGSMTKETLRERQGWALAQKIDHSLGVIDQFVSRTGGKCFVSFSGGKDSTVLLDLCRIVKPDILAVFSNTGMEYPDIVRFVKGKIGRGENIRIIRPKLTPRQVWERFGFPLTNKDNASKIINIRRKPDGAVAKRKLTEEKWGLPKKFQYLLSEPYDTSPQCCAKLKKEPMMHFIYESGLSPIVGNMASESKLREQAYIRNGGCNVFKDITLEVKKMSGGARYAHSQSTPLSIWMEQDIWDYIGDRNVEIADIYRKGAKRTGCVGCGFGAHFPGDDRFGLLYRLYPKYYEAIMNYTNNGVRFRDALRKALAIGDGRLPDEIEDNLFNT